MATKKVSNKTAKQNSLSNNMDKIQKTAKTVNKEIFKTIDEVMDDVVANGQQAKTLATKTVKEAGKKIKFSKSVDKITKTAKTVNKEVFKTAEEVLEDVIASGKEFTNTATKTAKEALENINVTERLDDVKDAAKSANKYALGITEEIIDGVITNGEKWQNVAAKAVNGGLKLAEKQQTIVFDTLDTVKGQMTKSASRMWNILKN